MTGLGVLLAAHRRHAGLTQEELSERSRLSVRAISDLEGGRVRAPRPRTVGALAEALTLAPADRGALERAVRANRAAAVEPPRWPDEPLPLPPAGFTGRVALLDALRDRRDGVVVLHGAVGVGKTSVALVHAHRVADRLPGGVAHVAVGDRHHSAAVPRSASSGRGGLLLLDDVVSEDHVRPLLDSAGDRVVLITSRGDLPGLRHATRFAVDALRECEAMAVLRDVVGSERVDADLHGAHDLVRLCGGLPLALRAAANRLASRPRWPVRHLVDRLRDRTRRWEVLDAADDRLSTAVESAYRRLDDDSVRALLALGRGAHPARATDLPVALWRAGLAEPAPGGGYAVPELVLAFAEMCVRRGDGSR
ncbi:helix-turn-helix domain-containing protein [Umezawaea sp. NPDC059074]|uniref:helix-turn-helix domain-containing protein n=1 Tax=Umezawaea sp. NPDC059074 TaxID=3346716 RepID=UPI0036BAC7BB